MPESSSKRCHVREFALLSAIVLISGSSSAEDDPRVFAGAVAGVSALSADARSVTTPAGAATSLYDAANGPALNVFGGVDLAQYFSVQVSWMWNRNDLTLTSASTTPPPGAFYEQGRRSQQHAVVFDGLVYFRRRDSAIRPYLGTGLSVLHFSSEQAAISAARGLAPPTGDIASTHAGLRSHVGIDVRLSRRFSIRYSFSETISANPIAPSLTPPGKRPLMNFQNLFGFVSRL